MAKGATKEQLLKAFEGEYRPLDEKFCQQRSAKRFLSNDAATRTHALVQEILQTVQAGAAPEDMMLICSSPLVAEQLKQEFSVSTHEELQKLPDTTPIVTVRSVALDILQRPEAPAITHRTFSNGKPRLLFPFEEDFILEDLKSLGTRPKRLREVLKFIYRGWTELSDETEDWLVTVEEDDIVDFMHSELRYLQGVIEPELSNLASKVIRTSKQVQNMTCKKHVFVFDYQNISRASQLLCNALAKESIAISADPDAAVEVYESYPHLDGVEEFLRVNSDATTEDLDSESTSHALQKLEWRLPEDEINGIADDVAAKIDAGAQPESIALLCFHPHWNRQLARALEERDIPTNARYAPLSLRGDVRYFEDSIGLRVITVLRLLDDPDDSMGLRCWMGFGDYLTHSNTFVPQRKKDQERRSSACFASQKESMENYSELQELLAACADKTGSDLLDFLIQQLAVSNGEDRPTLLAPLYALGANATPHDMLELLEKQQFFCTLPHKQGVTVTSMQMAVGMHFDTVYAVGCVNGFFPEKRYFDLTQINIQQQERMEKVDRQRFAGLMSCAAQKLYLSCFTAIHQETAERCKIKQERIYVEPDGQRYGQTSLCIYATEALQNA